MLSLFQERHAEVVRRNKEIREELTAWTQAPQTHHPHKQPPYLWPSVRSHPTNAAPRREDPPYTLSHPEESILPLTNSILSW